MKVEIRMLSAVAMVAVMMLGMLALPAAQAEDAGGTWDGGVAVQKNLWYGNDPFVAQSANGNMMAVWSEADDSSNSYICHSMYTPETGWSWPEVLDASPSGESVSYPQVGMGDNGSAILCWLKYTTKLHIMSRTYDPGNGWSEVYDLGETRSGTWKSSRLAVNGHGEAILAHKWSNSTSIGVEVHTYTAGSGWEAEMLQTVPNGDLIEGVYGTLTDSGRAAVSWLHADSNNRVMVSTRAPTGEWGPPTEIDDMGMYTTWNRVGVDDSTGEFMVAYMKNDPPYTSTYYSVTVDGTWSSPEPVAGVNNTYSWNSNMVMNRDGKAMVVSTDQTGAEFAVNVTMYDDGEWTPMISLASNLSGLMYPEIAIDDLGRAVVTWAETYYDREAAVFTPWIGWSEIERIELNAAGSSYSIGSVSMESGTVLVGYYAFTSASTIWVSTYSFPDAAPPDLQVDQTSTTTDRPLFEISGTTEPDAILDVNGMLVMVSASGEFSALVELDDGANALTVTAMDAAGNVANVSLTVTYNDPVPGLEEHIAEQQDAIDQLQEDLDSANDEIASVGSTAMPMGILGVVGLIVAVVALVLVFLRRKG
ncbi:MAG: hypothetical protein GXY70_03340 [Euryarchaeota archaeon]|nr:hypothetical protein [Euryarchaeota archaeon]